MNVRSSMLASDRAIAEGLTQHRDVTSIDTLLTTKAARRRVTSSERR